MKKFVVCLSLLAIGCFHQTYHSTRVGPDRFTVVSTGNDNGAENFGRILEEAYMTCERAGFADYTVTGVVHEARRVIAFIRCEKDKVKQEPIYQPLAKPTRESDTDSDSAKVKRSQSDKSGETTLSEDLDKLYQSAKKKLAGATTD